MSAVFKRDMVTNRNYTLRLIRKKFTAYVYTDSAKLLHFTILGGSAVPLPLNDATGFRKTYNYHAVIRPIMEYAYPTWRSSL